MAAVVYRFVEREIDCALPIGLLGRRHECYADYAEGQNLLWVVAQSDCRTDPVPGAKSEMRQIRVVAHKPCWYEGLGAVAIPVLVVVTFLSVHDHRYTFWKDSSAILDVADGGPWGGERGGREEA